MFDGLTAWFSSSVDETIKQHWENNHGAVCGVDEAQFLFSQNTEIQDTKRLYESEAYLNEHLTIFHVQYISDCIKSGDRKKVVLGKYFLPPLEIQNLIRNQVEFIWEKDKPSKQPIQVKVNVGKRKTDSVVGGDNSSPVKSRCPRVTETGATTSVDTDSIHIKDLPKIRGQIEDFIPGENGCEVFLKM
ncbi:hypothetical protein SNE40_012614 [Patella caerulea]|uniref:Uncharacterized protein n=1 Tax=Patella caerulea TaxID=87958 RepID=A0AAN8JMA5_PATCE